MEKSICDTIEPMLASVQEEVNDPELTFKLRTARQLIMACDHEINTLTKTLDEVELDDETMEKLRQLGYLD